jgi:hypothetical protein
VPVEQHYTINRFAMKQSTYFIVTRSLLEVRYMTYRYKECRIHPSLFPHVRSRKLMNRFRLNLVMVSTLKVYWTNLVVSDIGPGDL